MVARLHLKRGEDAERTLSSSDPSLRLWTAWYPSWLRLSYKADVAGK